MEGKGMLIVVSGLSGAGKGTLCNLMLEQFDDLCLSISATTRKPRVGEINGTNYFFTDKEDFEQRIEQKEFLEWAKVYNNYYGAPKSFVEQQTKDGKDVILEIDIQGALQIKEQRPEGVFIFILPPNIQEQEKRIIRRGSETDESVKLRLKCAQEELNAALSYDYIVVNQDLEEAAEKLRSIIIAERCKTSRNYHLID